MPRVSHFNDSLAFRTYASLGDTRTYAQVAERLGVSERTVARHAQRNDWQTRLALAEKTAGTLNELADPENLPSAVLRQQNNFMRLQKRAMEYLEGTEFKTVAEAVRALEACARAERDLIRLPSLADPAKDKERRDKAALEELAGAEDWDDES